MFAMSNREVISEEVLRFSQRGVPNWILDLTTTSFFSQMRYWGDRYKVLDVICDSSKPLKADLEFIDLMIGRRDKARTNLFGKEVSLVFNLKRRPLLANSHEHAGLQLADVIASAAAFTLRALYRGDPDPNVSEWYSLLQPGIDEDRITGPFFSRSGKAESIYE